MEFTEYVRTKPPAACDDCKSKRIRLTTNREAYGPRAMDAEVTIYLCLRCKASVAVHPGTVIPMGLMADARTRALRARAHLEFDGIWKHGKLNRAQAYRMLREALDITEDECHMAMMSRDQLRAVMDFARYYASDAAVVERRRKEKKHDRFIKRAERTASVEAHKRREKRAAYGRKRRRGYDD